MNTDINNVTPEDPDKVAASLYTKANGEHVVKKSDINVKLDKNNPNTRRIIIEKQVNVINKQAVTLKASQSELLNQISNTAVMAIQSIETIIKDITCDELRQEINNELEAYKNIHTKTVDCMLEHGIEPDKTNPITKAIKWSAIKINAMANKTTSHTAEMMINGTTMGIIEVYKGLNKCTVDEKSNPKPLANELLSLLRSSIDSLVKFL